MAPELIRRTHWHDVPVDHEEVEMQRKMSRSRSQNLVFNATEDPIFQGLPPIREGGILRPVPGLLDELLVQVQEVGACNPSE